MNKKMFEIVPLSESDDYSFWKNKTHLERLEALEKLRRIIFGYDSSAKRLQRVIKITELKKN
ncbi:MAG: hypothetical protein ABIH85_03115 [Candidatus Omnitrophota bacterium]|nr:hypothetical protein [Candidatus Omnitrophota bacterium]MBU1894835.1 hypothetical protein [Candidatus Omnitrophota bacterium]